MPRKPSYPFESLAVGDAFDITHTTSVHNVRSLAGYYARKLGRRFDVRWIADERVIEVSRIADDAGAQSVEFHVPRGIVGTLSADMERRITEEKKRIDEEWENKKPATA